jgi:hypothetical protein
MGTPEHRGWAGRWVAGALGGALLLGTLGAQAVPPPPPLLRFDPQAAHAKAPRPPEPEAPTEAPQVGPALIWILPMAGQLSGAPNAGE